MYIYVSMRRIPDYIEYPLRDRILIISGTGNCGEYPIISGTRPPLMKTNIKKIGNTLNLCLNC